MKTNTVRRTVVRAGLAAGALLLAVLPACRKTSPPQMPLIHTTKAFDGIYGQLPPIAIPAPCHATVAFFPSSIEPGKFRPVPIFVFSQGKEEETVLRTFVGGIGGEGGPVEPLLAEIAPPFPAGAELSSLSYEGGLAKVTVGGTFRAAALSGEGKERAAKALSLTLSQFGRAERVEVTDEGGTDRFRGEAGGAETVDIGAPKLLGLMAIREEERRPPEVLSVLFDRPVFVDDAAFYPPGGDAPYRGKVYTTGFGMTLEFHPEPKAAFDPSAAYRVRVAVRDGKGRKTSEDRVFVPKAVTRH